MTIINKAAGVLIIEPEPASTCELFGKTAETRPYGPGGKRICFQCMMKDEHATMRRFQQLITPSN